MNIRYLSSLLTAITFIFCQSSLAQSIGDLDILEILNTNPSVLEDITAQKNTQYNNDRLISKNQNVLNSLDTPQLNLTIAPIQNTTNEQLLSNRYFKALTGQILNVYGSNEFNVSENDELVFFNTIGKDYQLAPGDIIQIIITGLYPLNKNFQVTNDGTITLQNTYPLNLSNMTLDQASKLILDKILLDDASAEVFVKLNTARLVTVQISGNVKFPRTIAVPAYTPISRVIAYSGGISDNGSLRNIILNQIGEINQTIDFYDFLQNPSPKTDPLIKNSARIFVPNKGSIVAVHGYVNNPGIYELPNDITEIKINDLLKITGTSFFPPGTTLKVSYFDINGLVATRLALKNEFIKEGEALQVNFIETQDLNISKVYGAVLKNYEIKTKKSLSIKEVLKDGAVLARNAYYQFAIINGKDVQAINLNDALADEDITLPPGSDLLIFSKEDYSSLVAENPNKSLNQLSPILAKAKNIAEIYIDGIRTAYVPVNQNHSFSESINNFYIPGPKTIFDIALIENNSAIEAVDLKTEIGQQGHRTLNNGDRLFIFEDKFYDSLLKNIISNRKPNHTLATQTGETAATLTGETAEAILLQQNALEQEEEYLERINLAQKILQRANLINIKLDGELFTYLPYIKGVSSSFILRKLQNRLPKLVSEFAVVQNINIGKAPEIKNLSDPFEIRQGEEISLISSRNYRLAIKGYDDVNETNLLSELKSSNAVKIYYDGRLILLLPPNYRPSELKLFEQYTKNSDLYKLYVGLNTTSLENRTWDLLTFGSEEFFSSTNNLILGPSNIVNLFSNSFIRNEFINDKVNINGVNFNIKSNSKDTIVNTISAPISNANLIDGVTIKENSTSNQSGDLNTHLKIMKNSLRTITGSVQFPGSYPVAKKIRLSNFLSTAGLVEHTAKSDIIITEAINQENRLIKVNPKIIKINDVNLNKTILSGLYYLDIPLAINDAITGIIELKGEVLIPGKYSFTRSEKLQDIIKRAGGLSDVAFPLGAILERESGKQLEKATNNILADQLEASILNLAQSSLEGAGDQVKVVLGYASQLRNQPTMGRMALNILDDNPSNPIFLEDGDKLTVPKRPSHVSVVGSVQRSTIASYVPGNNYNDYLQIAGGVTNIADTRKAYLLLPNGESRQLSKTTLIPVGSTIIVPPKLDRLSILGGTDIISKVLNNISNSILSIKNVD